MNSNRNWMMFYFIYGFLAKVLLINVIISVLVEKYIASKEKLGKKIPNYCFYNYIFRKGELIDRFSKRMENHKAIDLSNETKKEGIFLFPNNFSIYNLKDLNKIQISRKDFEISKI